MNQWVTASSCGETRLPLGCSPAVCEGLSSSLPVQSQRGLGAGGGAGGCGAVLRLRLSSLPSPPSSSAEPWAALGQGLRGGGFRGRRRASRSRMLVRNKPPGRRSEPGGGRLTGLSLPTQSCVVEKRLSLPAAICCCAGGWSRIHRRALVTCYGLGPRAVNFS